MMSRTAVSLAAACLAGTVAASAAEPSPHFAALKPILGKTWRAPLEGATADKPKADVQRWEVALNGQAVRVLHSINDGEYGGESLIVWDQEKQSLVFYYFTTAGFYTTGTATTEDGALVTMESVKGSADGITQVKGVTRLLPDGRLHVKTQYLKNGAWTDGRDMHYVESPSSEVRFK